MDSIMEFLRALKEDSSSFIVIGSVTLLGLTIFIVILSKLRRH